MNQQLEILSNQLKIVVESPRFRFNNIEYHTFEFTDGFLLSTDNPINDSLFSCNIFSLDMAVDLIEMVHKKIELIDQDQFNKGVIYAQLISQAENDELDTGAKLYLNYYKMPKFNIPK